MPRSPCSILVACSPSRIVNADWHILLHQQIGNLLHCYFLYRSTHSSKFYIIADWFGNQYGVLLNALLPSQHWWKPHWWCRSPGKPLYWCSPSRPQQALGRSTTAATAEVSLMLHRMVYFDSRFHYWNHNIRPAKQRCNIIVLCNIFTPTRNPVDLAYMAVRKNTQIRERTRRYICGRTRKAYVGWR